MWHRWALVVGLSVVSLMGWVIGQEKAGQPPAKPKTYRPALFTAVTIVKVDTAGNTVTVKGIYRGKEVTPALKVVADSKLMKEGKDAKLGDFKEGDQALVTWKRGMKEIRYLADAPTYFAFLRYPTVKGKVKSFDANTLTLTVEAEGKEHKFTLPGKGECCFAGGKAHGGKAAVWKGGEGAVVVLRAPDQARAVFDTASWKLYGEREWQAYQKRRKTRQKSGE